MVRLLWGSHVERSVRNNYPHIDDRAGWFSLVGQALDGLEAIHPVVCGLHWSFPCLQAEDAFHRVKRELDEVTQVLYFVRVPGRSDPEVHAYGKAGILWWYADCGDR